jgi:hypothetical protein
MDNQAHCKVTTHGSHQLELMLKYPVSDHAVTDRYNLDVYFFTPCHLAVTEETYPARQFLQDFRAYVRTLPAPISFANLANPECEWSPLSRVIKAFSGSDLSRKLPVEKILYELRMLVNIHHEELKGLRQILTQLFLTDTPESDIIARIRQIGSEHDNFLHAYRQLHVLFADTRIPETLRSALQWADEAISIKTGRECHKLRVLCGQRSGMSDLTEELIARCRREQTYRASRHFETVIDPQDPVTGEVFLYRESMLKKWAQGATYMSVARSRTGVRIGHILAGIAAALAMLFAVGAMFLAECLFVSYSLPWAILIVVSYMFKDRIKEIVRGILLHWQPKLVADDISALADPLTKKRIGRTRSRVRFLEGKNVPEFARQLRETISNPFRNILPAETVLHFHHNMKLDNKSLLASHSRLDGIGAIFRLRIDSWLKQMDDPVNSIHYVNETAHATMQANRVYHINMAVRFCRSNKDAKGQVFHARLILNRNGILRVE